MARLPSFENFAIFGLCVVVSTTSALAQKQTNAPDAEKTKIKVERIAKGLSQPWGLQFLPDGRFLVTERSGQLRLISQNGKLSKPVKGVPKVLARGQGGLLDVRLARDFETSGTIFLSYAEPRGTRQSSTTIARAKLVLDDSGNHRLEDVAVIFRQNPAVSSGYHFGSRIVIAPDNSLFITTGDRGSRRDAAQDPNVPIGAVIRINPDGTPHPDNPNQDGWAPEIWSIGHRNIQGAVWAPEANQLWTVEHGARGGDELNHPEKGKNYGWPVITYGRDYSGAKIGIGPKKEGTRAASLLLGSFHCRFKSRGLHRRSLPKLERQLSRRRSCRHTPRTLGHEQQKSRGARNSTSRFG